MTRRCKSLVSHFVRVAVINHTRLEKTVSVRPRAQCLAHGGVSFSPASVWEVMGVSVLCLLECMEESSPSSPVQLYGPCTLLRVVPGAGFWVGLNALFPQCSLAYWPPRGAWPLPTGRFYHVPCTLKDSAEKSRSRRKRRKRTLGPWL